MSLKSELLPFYPNLSAGIKAPIAQLDYLIAQNEVVGVRRLDILKQQLVKNEALTALDTLEDGSLNPDYQTGAPSNLNEYLRKKLFGKVLDVGSGDMEELKDIVPCENTTYVDRLKVPRSYSVLASVEKLPFADKSFDSIFSKNLLNSYFGAKAAIPELFRVLRPGGNIVIIPHYNSLTEVLFAFGDLGIDVDRRCELVIFNGLRYHKTFTDLRFNLPLVVLTLTPCS